MPKENFNFIDVEPLLRSQRAEELPLGQIRVSKGSLCIPKWMLDDKNRTSEKYSLHIDQDSRILLIKPDDGGNNPFIRKTKIGLTVPAKLRSKKLIAGLMGQRGEGAIFGCRWSERHKGFIVDFKSPLVGE